MAFLLHDNASKQRLQHTLQTADQCNLKSCHTHFIQQTSDIIIVCALIAENNLNEAVPFVEDWLGARCGSFYSQGRKRWQKSVSLHGDYVEK